MPIRVGVIGAGVMGADHIKNLGTAISGADVTFVADLDAGRAAEAAPPSARITTDPSELINSSEVDAVVVASHDSTLLSLGFMRRFDPGYVALRRSVQERAQGEPLLVRCTSRNAAAGPGTTAESAITNSAIHELDIIPWLLGASKKPEPAGLPCLRTGGPASPKSLAGQKGCMSHRPAAAVRGQHPAPCSDAVRRRR